MVPANRVLTSFLNDSLRMAAEAARLLREIGVDSQLGPVDPEKVRTFYQIVHTMKGTATMVPGGDEVVASLQTLESRLACEALPELAKRLDWMKLAVDSLGKGRDALLALKDQSLPEAATIAQAAKILSSRKLESDRGLLARVYLEGASTLLWFPISSLTRVLAPDEVGGKEMLCLQGSWVPVVGAPAKDTENGKRAAFGLGVRIEMESGAGQVVVAVEEFVSLMNWIEASRVGAKAGIAAIVPAAPTAAPAKRAG